MYSFVVLLQLMLQREHRPGGSVLGGVQPLCELVGGGTRAGQALLAAQLQRLVRGWQLPGEQQCLQIPQPVVGHRGGCLHRP